MLAVALVMLEAAAVRGNDRPGYEIADPDTDGWVLLLLIPRDGEALQSHQFVFPTLDRCLAFREQLAELFRWLALATVTLRDCARTP